jgi:hypothetical protein
VRAVKARSRAQRGRSNAERLDGADANLTIEVDGPAPDSRIQRRFSPAFADTSTLTTALTTVPSISTLPRLPTSHAGRDSVRERPTRGRGRDRTCGHKSGSLTPRVLHSRASRRDGHRRRHKPPPEHWCRQMPLVIGARRAVGSRKRCARVGTPHIDTRGQ